MLKTNTLWTDCLQGLAASGLIAAACAADRRVSLFTAMPYFTVADHVARFHVALLLCCVFAAPLYDWAMLVILFFLTPKSDFPALPSGYRCFFLYCFVLLWAAVFWRYRLAEVSSSSWNEEMDCPCLPRKLIITDSFSKIMMRLCKMIHGAGLVFVC